MAINPQIQQIRDRRKAIGIRQNTFAREAGITQAHLCNLESGKQSNMTTATLEKIQAALHRLEQREREQSD